MTIVTVEPAAEPVSLADLKEHLRVDTTAEDDLITSLGEAAREWVEQVCGMQLVEATLRDDLDGFPDEIRLGRYPVQSVSSITYTDTNGDTQTWASSNYQTDLGAKPARIRAAYGVSYPSTRSFKSVSITYVAGYASGGSPTDHGFNVPSSIKAAIKLLVGHWYTHRMAVMPMQMHEAPMAVQSLLAPYRLSYIPE
jgi:uncharacterized phiE125 gp8 family phage protein